jgi:hypothetical protein
MSGYLLRMAANVRNPGGLIHPMLGSVFSTAPPQPAAENVPVQDPVRTPDRRLSVSAPPPDAGDVATIQQPPRQIVQADTPGPAPTISSVPSTTSHFPTETTSEHVQAEPARVEKTSFTPLVRVDPQAVPQKSLISEAGEFGQPAQASNPDPTAMGPPAKPRQIQNADPVSEERAAPLEISLREIEHQNPEQPDIVREVVRKDHYRPLMAERAPRTEERSSNPFPTGAQRAERRDFSGRAEKPERQPDEIQIHIGRIEVTAAPPAPTRPEIKPANKSPNLGEYLKRRHGRF